MSWPGGSPHGCNASPSHRRPGAGGDTTAAAQHLGLSRHALHRLTAERRIPFTQGGIGARCYFKRADLDVWRENGARGPR